MTPDKPISIAICFVGVVCALALPRRFALLALAIPMVGHTSTLLVPPDNLSMTAQRIIALVLILRCLLTPSIRATFKWRWVDTAAAVYFLMLTASQVLTMEVGPAINNRAGFFLQALVPFWCARFLLTDKASYYAFLKGMLWVALPLAVLGFIEMQTAWNPWDRIRDFGILKVPREGDGWREFMGIKRARARGPFLQYIMFGWFFALLVPLCTALYFQKRKLLPWVIAWCVLPLGIISSIASGPMMLAGMAMAGCCCFPVRRYWKVFGSGFLVLFLAVLVYSNRSFMQIISSFGFDPNSSWYRYSLVRFTLEQGGMKNQWLFGFGHIPGHYDYHHDLCIHWVWLLVVHGLVGVLSFHALIATIGWGFWRAMEKAVTLEDRWIVWSMFSTLMASLAAMLVVALFAELYYFYHLLLGVMANAVLLVGGGAAAGRVVGVLTELDGRQVLLRYHLKPGQTLAVVNPDEQELAAQPRR